MIVDVNLNISWTIHDKYAQIVKRFWDFIVDINQKFEITPIPYVHGDTLTATTADKASFLNKFWVVHVEAWIRTFTPKEFLINYLKILKHETFLGMIIANSLHDKNIYELGSSEPYPEQFDTRWIEGSAWVYALPHEIYKENFKKRMIFRRKNVCCLKYCSWCSWNSLGKKKVNQKHLKFIQLWKIKILFLLQFIEEKIVKIKIGF